MKTLYNLKTEKQKEVDIGFSAFAFFFPALWALFNLFFDIFLFLMIGFGFLGMLLTSVVNTTAQEIINHGSADKTAVWVLFWLFFIAQIIVRIYLGIKGNQIKYRRLIENGYIEKE